MRSHNSKRNLAFAAMIGAMLICGSTLTRANPQCFRCEPGYPGPICAEVAGSGAVGSTECFTNGVDFCTEQGDPCQGR